MDGRDILAQGIIKRVGDGESTHIWSQNWIPRDSYKRPIASVVQNPPTMVAVLIESATASWREDIARSVFTPFDVETILGIPLCTRRISDFWAWHEEPRGFFTVRSAYRMIVRTKINREGWIEERVGSSHATSESNEWTAIWKIQVPTKLQVFIWRLAQHSVPSGEVLHHRNMATTAACALCGAHDTWQHALLSCPMSRCTWALSLESVVEQMGMNQDDDARNWIFSMHHNLQSDDFVRLVVTLWAIWGARRKALHEGIFQSPHAINGFITSYLEGIQLLARPSQTGPSSVAPANNRWLPPPVNFSKVNVDAAVRRNGSHGGSGSN